MKNLESQIHEVVLRIARRHNETLTEIKNNYNLVTDLGFTSLDFAELVATLEIKLGIDPFATRVAIVSIQTVGNLYIAYQQSYTTSATNLYPLPSQEP